MQPLADNSRSTRHALHMLFGFLGAVKNHLVRISHLLEEPDEVVAGLGLPGWPWFSEPLWRFPHKSKMHLASCGWPKANIWMKINLGLFLSTHTFQWQIEAFFIHSYLEAHTWPSQGGTNITRESQWEETSLSCLWIEVFAGHEAPWTSP